MNKVYNFTKYRFLFITLSLLCIAGLWIGTAVRGGFNMGVEFQAGMSMKFVIDQKVKAPIETVRKALGSIEGVQILVTGDPASQNFLIKTKQVGDDKEYNKRTTETVVSLLEKQFGAGNSQLLQADYVGPRFSSDLTTQTTFITIIALCLILLYTWFRFQLSYAVAAIIAIVHDCSFMVGVIGAFQLEVNTTTVAAILTIIGYSINDTIVVFDRVRENNAIMRESKLAFIIDSSITQTLSRTMITGVSSLLALFAFFIFTTGDIKDFSVNMIVGILIGTYSSIFIASPVILAWTDIVGRRKNKDTKKTGVVATAEEQKIEEASEAEDDESAEANAGNETVEEQTEGDERKDQNLARLSREQRKRKLKK